MPYVQRDANGVVVAISTGEARLEDGTLLTDPVPLPEGHPDLVLPAVPPSVTMRQACQALIIAEKMSAVTAALDSMPGIQGDLARAEWNRSQVVERNRPLVIQMGLALGMTPADLDQLFILARSL